MATKTEVDEQPDVKDQVVEEAIEGLMPEAFREHGKSAYQEFVEGHRNLFNSTIDDLLDTIERAKLGKQDDVSEN